MGGTEVNLGPGTTRKRNYWSEADWLRGRKGERGKVPRSFYQSGEERRRMGQRRQTRSILWVRMQGDRRGTDWVFCSMFIDNTTLKESMQLYRMGNLDFTPDMEVHVYYVCCLRDIVLCLVWHLWSSIWNTSFSGVKSSWTSLYLVSYMLPLITFQF